MRFSTLLVSALAVSGGVNAQLGGMSGWRKVDNANDNGASLSNLFKKYQYLIETYLANTTG